MPRLACAAVFLCATAVANLHAQWNIQDSHTTADLRGIHALDNGIAWASGTEGTVLRTTNDGKDWQRCATPPDADHLDFRGIQAFDASTAIVMSSGKGPLSRLYKTTDACQTWNLEMRNSENQGFWDSVAFQHGDFGFAIGDSHTGVLIGDPIKGRFQTDVMILGHGWFVDDAGCTAPDGQTAFAASNWSVFVFGSRRYVLATGGAVGANVYISPLLLGGTTDKGCTKVSVPIAGRTDSSGVFSLFFRDAMHGVSVGGDYTKPNDSTATAARTKDMGLHWTAATNPPHGFRSAVAYDPTTKTWITVGPNGTDISTDDGRNWRPLRPTPTDPSDADQHWNALSLPFVVGPHGRIGKLNRDALSD